MKRSVVLAHSEKNQSRATMMNDLTAREREVMVLAVKGLANKEIARELKVTEGTVKIHLHKVYRKLGVKSRFALAARARRNMLSSPRNNEDDSSDAA